MRQKQDQRVVEQEMKGPLPDLEKVKPASNVAEAKSVAAIAALRATARFGYQGLSSLWVGNLLSQGHVFQEVLLGAYVLSFGFNGMSGLAWELSPMEVEGEQYFVIAQLGMSTADAALRLQFFNPDSLWVPGTDCTDAYVGVPTTVSFLVQF